MELNESKRSDVDYTVGTAINRLDGLEHRVRELEKKYVKLLEVRNKEPKKTEETLEDYKCMLWNIVGDKKKDGVYTLEEIIAQAFHRNARYQCQLRKCYNVLNQITTNFVQDRKDLESILKELRGER